MLRKDIIEHQENGDKVHLHLMLARFSLREEQHEVLSGGENFVFKLPDYAIKKEKNKIFTTNPFYTHPEGYKMCVEVDVNGDSTGEDSHLSIFTRLLNGRYDNRLNWPFLGTVTYELLNQLADDNHYHRVGIFDASSTSFDVGKVMGYSQFLPHSSLGYNSVTNIQYLLNDTLYFRVSVKVDNHKPWLVCTEVAKVWPTKSANHDVELRKGKEMTFKVTEF